MKGSRSLACGERFLVMIQSMPNAEWVYFFLAYINNHLVFVTYFTSTKCKIIPTKKHYIFWSRFSICIHQCFFFNFIHSQQESVCRTKVTHKHTHTHDRDLKGAKMWGLLISKHCITTGILQPILDWLFSFMQFSFLVRLLCLVLLIS